MASSPAWTLRGPYSYVPVVDDSKWRVGAWSFYLSELTDTANTMAALGLVTRDYREALRDVPVKHVTTICNVPVPSSVLTAFGLTKFAEYIPSDKPASEVRAFVVSFMEPFACVLDRLKPLKSDQNTQCRDVTDGNMFA
jgi:hypothetical protein